MIKKLLRFRNVGLFLNGCPNGAVDLQQTTTIYADNGRGKSTLASVLRACHTSDADRVNARRTIDSEGEPVIELLMESGARGIFEGGTWSGTLPNTVVFDSEFVERNVYSGFSVKPEQRQALLDFALGDDTVLLKAQVEEIARAIAEQTRSKGEQEHYLSGLASPLSLEEFIILEPIANAEDQIIEYQKRIGVARNATQLNERKDPAAIEILKIDLKTVFDVLASQLADIDRLADKKMKDHLAKHGGDELEPWISQGQSFLSGQSCPFCGQGIRNSELIEVYKSYFSIAYQDLKAEVVTLEKVIVSSLSDTIADSALAAAKINTAKVEAWNDLLGIHPPTLDGDCIRKALADARKLLLTLVKQKIFAPLEPIGKQTDITAVIQFVASINSEISNYNTMIDENVSMITDYKRGVKAENIDTLEAEKVILEANIRRNLPEVVQACEKVESATKERNRLSLEKVRARKEIDTQMQATLNLYQTRINNILDRFGASFSINRLSANYRGRAGEPRTEYVIAIRNQMVSVGSSNFSAGHNFSTTLSDADKRTLAFAFFVARLEADPALSSKVVILDDPVSSMDRNRRYQTICLVSELASRCNQLIVMSHDAYFIRKLKDRLLKQRPNPISPKVLGIGRVENGYSAFENCDLDEICASDYYRHHQMIAAFVEGTFSGNIRDVAKAIRPLLEGYLHQRFPMHIPRNLMFGKIISDHISTAEGGPLSSLQQHTKELSDINEYACQFHHDTNHDVDSVPVVDAELLMFARRSLDMIYTNG